MAYKDMTVAEALEWVKASHRVYNESPTTVAMGDAWIIRAGQMCHRQISTKGGGRPITDEDVRKSLGFEELPDDILI